MSRYETRYDEKIMKHYFYDTELKEMVKFDDVRNYLNQQDRQIKELKNQLAEKDKEIERLRNCVMTEEQVKQIMQEGMYETMVEQFKNGCYDKHLKSLAIKTLEDILNKFDFYENSQKDTMIPAIAGNVSISEYITNIIKGLKGE